MNIYRMATTTDTVTNSNLFEPQAWGLSPEAITGLGARLYAFWERFAACFETTTRDTSPYAYDYLSGLLRMVEERNYSNIARSAGHLPQNVQHFMTNSPWAAQDVLRQIRAEISATPQFAQGSVLILDESAEEKASEKTVGAARQYNGRLGKVEMSQVGTFLAYAHAGLWTWVDGELFLPEHWFSKPMRQERQRLALPSALQFATKIELGWRMIERAVAEGLPFELVCCDTLYGRSHWLRRKLAGAGLCYLADVPVDTQVYLDQPVVGVPVRTGGKGRKATKPRVLSAEKPVEVRQLAARADTTWTRLRIRATERGEINDEFSARRVWTTYEGEAPVAEWLVLRRDTEGKIYYALSNEAATTPLARLAWGKCQRHFIECANQEAKSEAGWDELRAQKYPGWRHHLALTCLATWFITQTKLEWREQHPRAPALAQEWGVDQLPELSMANIRELLRAVLPLPQLTVKGATDLVIEHLVNRTRSRKSRLKRLGYDHSLP
jgi:SRSO17 transposase